MSQEPKKANALVVAVSRITETSVEDAARIVKRVLGLIADGLTASSLQQYLEDTRLSLEDVEACLDRWTPEARLGFSDHESCDPRPPLPDDLVAEIIVAAIAREFCVSPVLADEAAILIGARGSRVAESLAKWPHP